MKNSTSVRCNSSRCTQKIWQAMCFTVHQILYYIFTKNPGDISTELAYLTRELKADHCVFHSLELRSAWALDNYYSFFPFLLPCTLCIWLPCGQVVCRLGAHGCPQGRQQNLLPCAACLLPEANLAFEGKAACWAFLELLVLSYMGPDNSSVDSRLSLVQLSPF